MPRHPARHLQYFGRLGRPVVSRPQIHEDGGPIQGRQVEDERTEIDRVFPVAPLPRSGHLVPRQELAVARSRAGAMKVYAVATLGQALGVLKSLGGEIPAPPGLRSAGA